MPSYIGQINIFTNYTVLFPSEIVYKKMISKRSNLDLKGEVVTFTFAGLENWFHQYYQKLLGFKKTPSHLLTQKRLALKTDGHLFIYKEATPLQYLTDFCLFLASGTHVTKWTSEVA